VRRVYEKGKITIPKELRGLMGIEEGDYVRLKIMEVVPANSPKSKYKAPDASESSTEPTNRLEGREFRFQVQRDD
jgi:AbrB family looped-hinge helix DNA binding protein